MDRAVPRTRLVAIISLCVGVFIIDLWTPRGTVEWVVYLLPVLLASITQTYIIVTAAVCTVLMAAGAFLSPPGISVAESLLNRGLGAVVLWVVTGYLMRLRRAEMKLRRQGRDFDGRARILTTILEQGDFDARMDSLLKEALDLLGLEFGTLHLVRRGVLRLRSWRGISDDFRAHVLSFPADEAPAFLREPHVVSEGLSKPAKTPDFVRGDSIQSWATLPLFDRHDGAGHWIGTLFVASRRRTAIDADVERTLRSLADTVILAIIESRSRRDAEERLVRLEALRSIDQAIIGQLGLREVLQVAMEGIPRRLKADAVAISFFGTDERMKVFTMRLPNGAIVNEEEFSLADSLLHWLVERREPVIIHDLTQDPRVQMHHERLRRAALLSYLGVPLVIAGRTVGVLHVLAKRPTVFAEEDVAFFMTLAGQTAIAVQAAESNEALRAEARVSAAQAQVGRELISSLGTPELLKHLCQVTTEVLECAASHTLLWQADRDAFVPVASFGTSAEEQTVARAVALPREQLTGFLSLLERRDVVDVGDIPSDIIPPNTSQEVHRLCMALRRGMAIIGIQVARRDGGSEPFGDAERRIAEGIAQIGSLALDHSRVVEELEKANRVKSDFVATMSHELRTPLHIIMGYNEMLLDAGIGPITAEQDEVLQSVQRNARDLLELITATLEFSRDTDRAQVDLREVSMTALLAGLEPEIRELPRHQGVRLEWDIAPRLPAVATDPMKLKVMLKNLLTNALKFTDHGSVRLSARHCDGSIEIDVADTGIGIPPDQIEAIFEPFRQADNSIGERYGGVGLGLSIVRRLLDSLGGTITVESEPGRGSTFQVRIPTTRD